MSNKKDVKELKRRAEELLDETVEESFPASDAPARGAAVRAQARVEKAEAEKAKAQPKRHTYPRR
jgi:hypothetical protein